MPYNSSDLGAGPWAVQCNIDIMNELSVTNKERVLTQKRFYDLYSILLEISSSSSFIFVG